jgi:ElaB/YqjD/DUF883 family membrane-anchored ribosome-binding protein
MKLPQSSLERFPAFFKAGTDLSPRKSGAVLAIFKAGTDLSPRKSGAVLAISTLLLFTSCQTKKQFARSETEIKTTSTLNTVKDVTEKTDTKAVASISGSVTETDNIVTEETITELSKPDSLGNQHPEKIINRKITSGKNKETKVVENTQLNQATENKISETENQVTEQELANKTEVKTKIRKYLPWKIVGVIVLLAAIGFLIWSRFIRRLSNKYPML